jgi:hypothetical protein
MGFFDSVASVFETNLGFDSAEGGHNAGLLGATFLGIGDPISGFIIGSGLEGARKTEQQAELVRQLREREAKEVLRRSELNVDKLRRDTQRLVSAQQAVVAGGNVDLGSSSVLLTAETTFNNLAREVQRVRDEAEFEAESIRIGADIEANRLKDQASAQRLGVFTDLISTGASFFLGGGIGGGLGSASEASSVEVAPSASSRGSANVNTGGGHFFPGDF